MIVRDLITEKSIKADSNYDALIQLKNDLETIDVVDLRDDLTRHTAESTSQITNLNNNKADKTEVTALSTAKADKNMLTVKLTIQTPE